MLPQYLLKSTRPLLVTGCEWHQWKTTRGRSIPPKLVEMTLNDLRWSGAGTGIVWQLRKPQKKCQVVQRKLDVFVWLWNPMMVLFRPKQSVSKAARSCHLTPLSPLLWCKTPWRRHAAWPSRPWPHLQESFSSDQPVRVRLSLGLLISHACQFLPSFHLHPRQDVKVERGTVVCVCWLEAD